MPDKFDKVQQDARDWVLGQLRDSDYRPFAFAIGVVSSLCDSSIYDDAEKIKRIRGVISAADERMKELTNDDIGRIA